jgi:uncharacterized membrane protein SpoIIM required for sporulation
MLPWTLISFVAAQLQFAGGSGLAFVGATIAPHGIVELPILLLLAAAALRWQSVIIAPSQKLSMTERWIMGWADFSRLFLAIGAPFLLLAAFLETYLTPIVVHMIFG